MSPEELPSAELQKLVDIVSSWWRGKGLPPVETGQSEAALPDGRTVALSADRHPSVAGDQWDVSLNEPTDAGRFHTRLVIGWRDDELHLFVELRAGAVGYRLEPLRVDPRCPQVVRELLASRPWTVGSTPLYPRAVPWVGTEAGRRFVQLLRHPDRNLPIVAISTLADDPWSSTLADDIGRDLCGLAIVCAVDEAASWAITSSEGREWSCYGGAVRIYWPVNAPAGSAYDHPLWTRARILAGSEATTHAAQRFRSQLRRTILEISTYAVDEPLPLRQLRDEAQRERIAAVRRDAEEAGDSGALAEQYFAECVRLEQRVSELTAQNAELHDRNASLEQVWKHYSQERAGDLAPEPVNPVNTVRDAVERARREFATALIFGGDVDRGIEGLALDAGPPEKILEHLRTLAEMTEQRRSANGLGRNMLDWLKSEGVKASGESQTTLNNAAEMRRRTWNDGISDRRFEFHLKPVEGTSPDRCVRIYFEYDESRAKTVIGWVGRHP